MKYNPEIVKAFFKAHNLPEPQTEFRFNPNRKWRFDFAFPMEKIALEVEGGIWSGGRHSRPTGIMGDIEKYNSAATLGWRVLRVTPQNLCMAETIELLKENFAYVQQSAMFD